MYLFVIDMFIVVIKVYLSSVKILLKRKKRKSYKNLIMSGVFPITIAKQLLFGKTLCKGKHRGGFFF